MNRSGDRSEDRAAILVVNADDFGMTEGHNTAIVESHRWGIVTSTSLLANGEAFDQAVQWARQTPTLGVGVHLTLTEGPPVASDVKVLTEADGLLPLSNQPFVRALLMGRLPHDAIRREFEAQISKVIAAGITPTHIDGHKYIHALPGISQIAAQAARQAGIGVMRVPYCPVDGPSRPGRIPGLLIISLLGALAYRVAQQANLRSSDRMAGFVDTGHLTPTAIAHLLKTPRPGVTELLCHPAYRTAHLDKLLARGYDWIAGYDFDGETAAVSDPEVRRSLDSRWTFRNFGQLSDSTTGK